MPTNPEAGDPPDRMGPGDSEKLLYPPSPGPARLCTQAELTRTASFDPPRLARTRSPTHPTAPRSGPMFPELGRTGRANRT